MKICIIGPKDSPEIKLLRTEAENQGYESKRIDLIDVYFEVKDGVFGAFHRKIDLMDYDVFLFRVNSKYPWNIVMLAEYLYSKGKRIIDAALNMDKCFGESNFYRLALNSIPQLETYQTVGIKSARDVLMEIDHPISIKFEDSSKEAKVIFSDDWTESYDLVRTNKNKDFTFRKVIETDHYYKVYVAGNEVVGGLHKTLLEDTFKLNYSRNVRSKNIIVSEEMSKLAISACKALNIEIASVDIVDFEGKLYVLDVHRAPKFGKFERLSKINYAKKIIEYCVKEN